MYHARHVPQPGGYVWNDSRNGPLPERTGPVVRTYRSPSRNVPFNLKGCKTYLRLDLIHNYISSFKSVTVYMVNMFGPSSQAYTVYKF